MKLKLLVCNSECMSQSLSDGQIDKRIDGTTVVGLLFLLSYSMKVNVLSYYL